MRKMQEKTSKAVSLALRLLHKENPLCKMVVSFADTRQNHVGTIYKATNWVYLGKAKMSTSEYLYNGKWVHNRTISSLKNKKILKNILDKRKASDKFKYVYCFDKELREKYQKMALQYPTEKDL